MRAKKFLILNLLGFVIIIFSYALYIDNFIIIDRGIPYTYKQFLLESTTKIKGKVIIESGSNSIYSINPYLLSKYFDAPVITISDNAGYPLKHKIFRLREFINEHDVILLPLEWGYYDEGDSLYSNYLSSLADKELRLEYYFNSLPFTEKVNFILSQYPFQDVINAIQNKRDRYKMQIEDFQRLYIFESLINSNSSKTYGNSSLNAPTREMLPPPDKQTCDEHNFKNSFVISNVFKNNLSLLKDLTKKGATVFFVWPGMADRKDSKCYQVDNLKTYVSRVKNIIESAGFKMIGDINQSHFSEDCILDSHYHIKEKCASIRTYRLLDELKSNHVPKIHSNINTNDFIPYLNSIIHKTKSDLLHKIISGIPNSNKGNVNFYNNIAFLYGWSFQEKFGRWSIGNESSFSFKLNPDLLNNKPIKIRLKCHYFNGYEKTHVFINDKSFGSHVLTDKIFSIPPGLIKQNQIITFRLLHTSPVSPLSLGISNDYRVIKLGLNLVEILDE